MSSLLFSRRQFIMGSAGVGLLMMVCPGMVLAQAATEERLVVVILRGGMDGLAAVVPYGDPDYPSLRGDLALSGDNVMKLNERFGLHPMLSPLHKMYQNGELAVIQAVASPYRERSHFDAQNIMELGSDRAHSLPSGWLNRVIMALDAKNDRLGMAMGQSMPQIMRGPAQVGSWAPSALPDAGEDFMSLVSMMYERDASLSRAYHDGVRIQDDASDALQMDDRKDTRKSRSPQAFLTMAKMAAQWLAKPDGARIATLELEGWDTHIQQGTEGGRLANNFDLLARGIEELKNSLGSVWSKTTVVIMTEFGRTARPNGNNGTDHGTGGVMLLAGGRIKGGIYGSWPGLSTSQLYEQRDLMPTTDLRSVMKGVLNDIYGFSPGTLNQDIYPDSGAINMMHGLIRT